MFDPAKFIVFFRKKIKVTKVKFNADAKTSSCYAHRARYYHVVVECTNLMKLLTLSCISWSDYDQIGISGALVYIACLYAATESTSKPGRVRSSASSCALQLQHVATVRAVGCGLGGSCTYTACATLAYQRIGHARRNLGSSTRRCHVARCKS